MEPITLQPGVWYKRNDKDRFILQYQTGNEDTEYRGYYDGNWREDWTGFQAPQQWTPASIIDLKKLGDEWEAYPWIDYEDPTPPTRTPIPHLTTKEKFYKYCFNRDEGKTLLLIMDLNIPGMPTVTNWAAQVVDEIGRENPSILPDLIFYCDTNNQWDQYRRSSDKFIVLNYNSLEELFEKYWKDDRVIR